MWHVSSRSGVATLRTAIHLLLTYLLTGVTCGRGEETKKERQRKKLHSGKLAIRRDHQSRPIELPFGMVGGLEIVW